MASAEIRIVLPADAGKMETLAAREVRRYFYLRTGQLASISQSDRVPPGESIVVARQDRALAAGVVETALDAQQYRLKTKGQTAFIVGGDDVGTLYAAYRFAEKLGVRFYLHGDVIPDVRIASALPQLEEFGKPLFSVRGIQPFHDFPEGPDWWNEDDYLACIAQLPKLRMNFIGLHTYPQGNVGPEPAVWIGRTADADRRGQVSFSYPAQWANTARDGMWAYAPMKTSQFTGGADLLFEADDFGPEVMAGLMPLPKNLEQSNRLFNRTGEMLGRVFAAARALGVKSCVGTETPLTIPRAVQERLKSLNKDPKDPAVVREIYEGMFRRIADLYPPDYYWLWTPERWTLSGNTPEQVDAVLKDIQAALEALNAVGKPFTLATCGWVLGPQQDRAALDRFLPKDAPMSAINRRVGHFPVDAAFGEVNGRPKWAIPWMENDGNMVGPQPWVGRMRYDAAGARLLGCTGLLGIHWRTKILAQNVAALAAAAWDQSWVPPGFQPTPLPPEAAVKDVAPESHRGRSMPVDDFYVDFARANFGESVAGAAGAILARIDGINLPEVSGWQKGPGGVKVSKGPWSEVRARFGFVDELAALRQRIRGAGNLERFDYWLNTYRYTAATTAAGCTRGQLDAIMAAVTAEKDDGRRRELAVQALAVRTDLARAWEKMISLQVSAADSPGELGTLANLEQHTRGALKFVSLHDEALARELGAPLPAGVEPGKAYTGPARIIVPAVRSLVGDHETIRLKIIALDQKRAKRAFIFWRTMGTGEFQQIALKHVARAVYDVTLPAAATDIEYYIRVETAGGKVLLWPSMAPALNQTMVRSAP